MQLNINGRSYDIDAPAHRTLADLLRYELGLTGTKEACGVGVCGACTVLLDGRMVASCIMLAAQTANAAVVTIEGLAQDGQLAPIQQSFMEYGGFQCGICTPGQIMAAQALLDQDPNPSDEHIKQWMMGNLCRCTGYYQITDSIRSAAESEAR